MDHYLPPDAQSGTPLPAVVIVAGYSDQGFQRMLSCKFKEMGSTTSWARLIAASGMIAITYSNRDPVKDVEALIGHLRGNESALGIDATRIGLWASSGNVPLAMSLLTSDVTCAALCYGYTLDLDGYTEVADAEKTFRFVNPFAGESIHDVPTYVPLFLVRAGQDQTPGLNASLDRFVGEALAHNVPVTLTNHPTAAHAFDLFEDSATTKRSDRKSTRLKSSHTVISYAVFCLKQTTNSEQRGERDPRQISSRFVRPIILHTQRRIRSSIN